ncbi:hypothetical protein [Taylorella equigenitalis]|uniref:Uncharacterized protein n=3 Tax=Taylorella equigenitalis TaxID=29575 RepID=A0A654KHT0_TAYEM|nr:hypothetical protein [Taylorella equigenitalis]ADU91416.1 hypothetical protein TEQUI_0473 [Taylorella equigenitalis MCE9]AFN36502.1 hypothetical protein KUI_1459 [Taylorella equigenitalis ATCC 35865]ASY31069.1 hypothetical protein B9Z30_06900 [Taylorella equigenitalis]ASY38371.1 hypothetical protein CA605_06820 [Taylorella equigenitalis]ASY39903.1 hypothetical protein CA604_07340 [Taylorella equigenitalis]
MTSESYDQKYIDIGIGLNQVDNLKPSDFFYKVIERSTSYNEAERKLIEEEAFKFSVAMLKAIANPYQDNLKISEIYIN